MSTLTAVLTHLSGGLVDERMGLLRAVSEEARFVVFHGGARSDFEQIEWDEKVFVDDATLRGPREHLQSLTQIFEAAWQGYFVDDPELDSLYLVEYDHLILDRTFESRMRQLALETGADLLGKTCVDRTATNAEHYVRFRRDPALLAHLEKLTVREDPARIFGCLGDGMWLSRRALEAYVSVDRHPPCYCETYVPTLLHHLGLRMVDVDAHSDLYRNVRWVPEYSVPEVVELARAGAMFVHPVKDQSVNALLRSMTSRWVSPTT